MKYETQHDSPVRHSPQNTSERVPVTPKYIAVIFETEDGEMVVGVTGQVKALELKVLTAGGLKRVLNKSKVATAFFEVNDDLTTDHIWPLHRVKSWYPYYDEDEGMPWAAAETVAALRIQLKEWINGL